MSASIDHLIVLVRRERFLRAMLEARPDDQSARHWVAEADALTRVFSLLEDSEAEPELRRARQVVEMRPPVASPRRA